jgi:hypothetical protein
MKIMKKIMSVLAVLFLALNVACANEDRPIQVEQLPAAAQKFIKAHFPDLKISYAKIDDELVYKEYEVMFADGVKIEFNGDGEWKDVDCKFGAVPAAIIPKKIASYVAKNYPDAKIIKIDRDRRDYEVSLSNRLELTFDMKFNLVEIDD